MDKEVQKIIDEELSCDYSVQEFLLRTVGIASVSFYDAESGKVVSESPTPQRLLLFLDRYVRAVKLCVTEEGTISAHIYIKAYSSDF